MTKTKTVLFMSQKGGVGKTMCADEFAFSLGRTGVPFNFYDLDGQGNAIHSEHRDPAAVVNIVDTAGRLDGDVLDVIANADVVVVPTRPTADDMRTVVTTLRAVRDRTDAPIVLVVNCMNRFSLATQIAAWIEQHMADGSIPACEGIVHVRQAEALAQARALHRSVVDYKRTSEVAGEVLAMANAVRRAAGLDVEMPPTQGKVLRDNGKDAM